MTRLARIAIAVSVAAVCAGCGGNESKSKHLTDEAIRACGSGDVAYVNVQEGRYACRGGGYSNDR